MSTQFAPQGAAPAPGGHHRATWHDPAADQHVRKELCQQISAIFHAKRGAQSQNWGSRLNEFVKRLEQELYKTARSKVGAGSTGWVARALALPGAKVQRQPRLPIDPALLPFSFTGGIHGCEHAGAPAPAGCSPAECCKQQQVHSTVGHGRRGADAPRHDAKPS